MDREYMSADENFSLYFLNVKICTMDHRVALLLLRNGRFLFPKDKRWSVSLIGCDNIIARRRAARTIIMGLTATLILRMKKLARSRNNFVRRSMKMLQRWVVMTPVVVGVEAEVT